MRIRRAVAGAVTGMAALGLCAAVAGAGSALAASAPAAYQVAGVRADSQVPVVYSGMGGRWASAAVRPRYMAMGAEYWYDQLRWSGWTGTSADGHGRIDFSNNGAAGPVHRYPVKVTFSDVRVHAGRRYFARMTARSPDHMAGQPGHGPTTLHLWMSGGQWTWT